MAGGGGRGCVTLRGAQIRDLLDAKHNVLFDCDGRHLERRKQPLPELRRWSVCSSSAANACSSSPTTAPGRGRTMCRSSAASASRTSRRRRSSARRTAPPRTCATWRGCRGRCTWSAAAGWWRSCGTPGCRWRRRTRSRAPASTPARWTRMWRRCWWDTTRTSPSWSSPKPAATWGTLSACSWPLTRTPGTRWVEAGSPRVS